MWWFGKKRKELIKKEIEKVIQNALLDGIIQKDLSISFTKMNADIMSAFNKTQEGMEINSTSIASLAQSIGYLLQAIQTIDCRVKTLEDLSLSQIKITGTMN